MSKFIETDLDINSNKSAKALEVKDRPWLTLLLVAHILPESNAADRPWFAVLKACRKLLPLNVGDICWVTTLMAVSVRFALNVMEVV